MEDFRTFIGVDSNFKIEQTIAENQILKYNNKVLLLTGFIVGTFLIGIAMYTTLVENNKKLYHTINQQHKL